MDAVRYLKERERRCDSFDDHCTGCEIKSAKNGMTCGAYIKKHPEQAGAIVEKWAKEHPRKTRKDDFFEKFPYAKKTHDGIPKTCVANLGYAIGCLQPYSVGNCVECWNRLLEEE